MTAAVRSSFSRNLKMMLVGCAALLIVTGAGISIYRIINSMKKMSITDEVLSRRSLEAQEVPAYSFPFEIKDMSIPLTNRSHTRSAFAQFTLILDCPNEEAKNNLTQFLPQLMNTILETGSNFYVEEFTGKNAEAGFKKFKEDLRISFSKYLGKYTPRSVVLKDWFVN